MKKILIMTMLIAASSSMAADDLAVTIYNSNLGVVSEDREFTFQKGQNSLKVTEIPSLIDAGSVRFDMDDAKYKISILEQNFAYDLINNDKMYQKYIDKKIELIGKEGQIYSGTLMAYDGGAVTLQNDSGGIKIIQLSNIAETNFPAIPDGLITKPTLFWNYISNYSGQASGKLSYQTGGMSWGAEYVGLISSDETKIDLTGWASITNQSGLTYQNATLKLIAGDINRAQKKYGGYQPATKSMLDMESSYSGFEEKSFFEYHMYTLPRKATLADKEQKQLALFEPAVADIEKVFIYRPERNATQVEVAVKMVNSEKAGLGIPLPEGRVRLFKSDTDGSMVLLGEDYIEHTPKNEKMNLQIGYAFDITAEHQLINQKRVTAKVDEREFQITINNRKKEQVVVNIEKKLYGYWEIIESTVDYEKENANTVLFKLPLNPEQSADIIFKVRYNLR